MSALALVFAFGVLGASAGPLEQKDCALYLAGLVREIRTADETGQPLVVKAANTDVAISRAMEKEGLFYEDIAAWFDTVDAAAFKERLEKRLELELSQKRAGPLTQWLRRWAGFYRATELSFYDTPKELRPASFDDPSNVDPRAVLRFLAAFENPFDVINMKGASQLFAEGFLSYDDLRSSLVTPAFITVGDDLGSWEIRSRGGTADLRGFHNQRVIVENFLEGPVGHQHVMHGWPADSATREKMVGQYIGLLDSTASLLFWRQIKRGVEVESIAGHPYLGLYTRASLNRLAKAVLENDPTKFRDKFRMVGARNFPGNDAFPGQSGEKRYPDWELRSGNKGAKRGFIENMIVSRLATGDYRGVKDFRSYEFDLSASIEKLVGDRVSADDVAVLQEFEKKFKYMEWSAHGNALNHFRNKLVAPLAPWANRLDLPRAKAEKLRVEQIKYAGALAGTARTYIEKLAEIQAPGTKNAAEKKAKLIEKTLFSIEEWMRDFAQAMELDVEFERALKPIPKELPAIQVAATPRLNGQTVDINDVALGIEYSFRFSDSPKSDKQAEAEIRESAQAFADEMGGGTIERMDDGGHGHGLSIKYIYTDLVGQKWRFEWDGVGRSYRDGKPYWRRRGHIEVPTPKFSPQTMDVVAKLFRGMRSVGKFPRRSAGGAHVNVDIGWLRKLPEKEGARKAADLLALFESNREMMAALWQHPYRIRNAIAVELKPEFAYQISTFQGGWEDLGNLLYRSEYFNPYVARKPSYVQLNALALMGNAIPDDYLRGLDIKNPERRWFPSFGGKGTDRLEFRLFDAPEDEYMAALQIKYVRAFLNRAWNAEAPIPLRKRYTTAQAGVWREDTEAFIRDAEAHLKWLGLDPEEFAPLIAQSIEIQAIIPTARPTPPKASTFRTVEEEPPPGYFDRGDSDIVDFDDPDADADEP